MKDQKVEFFLSESSFGSSSAISSSRLVFENDQIIYESQQIFSTLRNFLVPRQDLLDQNQLSHIIHRVRILLKQTIPNHTKNMTKTNKLQQNKISYQKYTNQLQLLNNHYQNYHNNQLSYEQFYKLYGATIANFQKKSHYTDIPLAQIQPDKITIMQPSPQKTFSNSRSLYKTNNNLVNQEKLIRELNEQIIKIKNNNKQILIKYQNYQQQLKISTQNRINNILKISHQQNQSQTITTLKQQLSNTNQQLQQQTQKSNITNHQLTQLQKQIDYLTNQNTSLRKQLQRQRRMKNSQAIDLDQQSDHKSIHSQTNGNPNQQPKNSYKKIKNLQYQINLLKQQLKNQRNNNYKSKKSKEQDYTNELTHLQQIIHNKNKEIEYMKIQLDKEKINAMKLSYKLDQSLKQTQLIKLQPINTPITPTHSKSLRNCSTFFSHQTNRPDNYFLPKTSITMYLGDGNQYSPYYDLLNKQFKIRFKRSCLKSKQLLHKANGLQIGIITEYQQPNQLKINLHLSNFCDQKNIKNLKIKTNNSQNNKIQIQKSHIDLLEIGYQIKNIINIFIRNYPIGCTALLCQYQYYGNNEQVRILLPVNIFKMLVIKPRDDQFRQLTKITIPVERKVAKQLHTYFKGATVQNNSIFSTIMHEHTETKLLCDITLEDNTAVIGYEHRAGQESITEYIIKSLSFLLKKEQIF